MAAVKVRVGEDMVRSGGCVGFAGASEAEELVGFAGGLGGAGGVAAVVAARVAWAGDLVQGGKAKLGEATLGFAGGVVGQVQACGAVADAGDFAGMLEDIAQHEKVGEGESVSGLVGTVPGGEEAGVGGGHGLRQ